VSNNKTIHHVGLTVRNLADSIEFYEKFLDCHVIWKRETDAAYLAEIVGYPEVLIRQAQLSTPGSGLVLELFEYLQPLSTEAPLEPRMIGNPHICFVVDELRPIYHSMVENGAEPVSGPVYIDSGVNVGGLSAYVRDPSGIVLELFELAANGANRAGSTPR
jgi:catechol 2,3-dioxygenase-like lactoylglutathione lyase family enzyme